MKKIIMLIIIAITLVGCNKVGKVGKVGDLRYHHSTYTQEVYVVLNEKGEEKFLLDMYVESCLSTYKRNGTYGKEVQIKSRIN